MIDSYAIALKRRPSVAAFVQLNACANANASAFDGVIVHSDADAMSAEMSATVMSNSDAGRQPLPRRS